MIDASKLNKENLNSLFVGQNSSILESMNVIDRGAVQLAMVVDEQEKLLGILTDGDLRRAILGGAGLDAAVLPFANTSYRSVGQQVGRSEALDLMKCFSIEQLPIVDEDGFVCGLHLLNELIQSKKLPNAAMILAGGKGTRLGKLTASTPKPMIKVAGRPILERIILHLVGGGIQHIFLSVNFLAEVIQEHFGNGEKFGCQITYLHESEPLGTGGPLALMQKHGIKDPVLVMNGDLITDFDVRGILSLHERQKNQITIGVKTYSHEVPFGCVQIEGSRVTSLVEKPTFRETVNAGIYAISPEIVGLVKPEFTPITQLIESVIEQGQHVGIYQVNDWIDVGQPDQLAQARGQ